MLWRGLAASALAAVVFAWSAPARAGDTVKLGLDKSSTPTLTLELKAADAADTTLAHWHRHYYGGGYYYPRNYGYAHYRGGYYRGWGGGYVSSFYFGGYSPRYYAPAVSYYYSSPVYYYSPP